MVARSYAVVYPRAVVIEPLHAAVADVAVPAARRADHLAVRARAVRLELLGEHLQSGGRFRGGAAFSGLPGSRFSSS